MESRTTLTIGLAVALVLAIPLAAQPAGTVATAVATPAILAPPDVIVGEGDDHVDLVVRLAEAGLSTVTVAYATANSSAAAGTFCNSDYVNTSGTLTFAPGETSKTVPVDLLDCANVEGFESFTLTLSSPVNATISRATVRVGIIDNNTLAPTPQLFVRDTTVDEKAGNATVPVLLGGPRGQTSGSTVTVAYTTTGGSAAAGSDYTTTAGTLTFQPGETAKTVVIPVADDGSAEPAETLTLTLSGPTNASLGDATGVIVIGASDTTPLATPALHAPPDQTVGEGDGYLDLPITLATPGNNTVTVAYTTANSSAAAGTFCNSDYINVSGTLTYAPGETTKTIRIDLLDCANVEGFESFTLTLSSPVNATISRATVRVGIIDNNTLAPTPQLFVRDTTVDEKAGNATVPVLLGGPRGQTSGSTVTVAYTTTGGSAAAGSDYTTTAGTLTFQPGETAKTVVIPVADDGSAEPAETLTLTLSGPTNASLGDATGVIVIGASDTTPLATPALHAPPDQTVGEGDGYLDLPITLATPGNNTVTVAYTTANSSAAAGTFCNSDYINVSGTITYAPGETTKTIRIDLLDCANVEGFESFTLTLSSPVNATISRATVRVGIIDNNTLAPTPQLFVRDATIDERDGSARVPVLLGGPRGQTSGSTVTVAYSTADGTATVRGADYAAVAGTLTFQPGETAKTVVIPVADDGSAEPAETLTLTLSGPTNASLGDATGVIVIGASDTTPLATPALHAPPDQTVGEGDGYLDLPITLATPGNNTVTVAYTTANSSAAAGTFCNSDYINVSGTITYAPGETTKTIRIDLLDCANVEGFESFTLTLSSPVNATISRATVRVGIIDNNTLAPTPQLFVRDATIDERDGSARVPVLLGGPRGQTSGSTVTVAYTTTGGSAAAGSDYTTTAGTLTFQPGETAKTVVIPVADDGSAEPAETLTLTLSGPTNASLGDATGVIVIGASDTTPLATPALHAPPDQTVGEGDGYLDLPITLATPGNNTVTVAYTTANSSAAAGTFCNSDYINVSGTITYAPGETTKTIRIDLLDCAVVEATETFSLTLSAPVNATIARVTTVISIADNSAAGTPILLSIAVTPSNPSLLTGSDIQFVATGTYSDATTADVSGLVTWTSSSTGVATISGGGLAHGVSAGTTTIKAAVGAVNGTTVLTVGTPTLISISVTPGSPVNTPGSNRQFTATGSYSNGTTANITGSVTWSSDKPAIATIAAGGLAHAVKKGTSTIRATLGPIIGSTLLTVK